MDSLDLTTVSTMTSLVVITAGMTFILETLLREEHSVSRIWSLGFLAGILASVSYMIWALAPAVWWAVAAGNAAFVASAGLMWLGCRRFNGRSVRRSGAIVVAFTAAAAIAVLIEGSDGGGWAGAATMYAGLAALPAAAAVETGRGALGRIRISTTLLVVFAAEAVFYASRGVVLVLWGDRSTAFLSWWGTIPASFITVVLTIVAAVVASVLRAERTRLRGRGASNVLDDLDGVLDEASFLRLLDRALDRRRAQGSERGLLAVLSFRLPFLNAAKIAFGAAEVETLRSAAREAIRSEAPVQSWVGADGAERFLLAVTVRSEAEAGSLASRLSGLASSALQRSGASFSPTVEAGFVVDGHPEVDAVRLIELARAAESGARATGE